MSYTQFMLGLGWLRLASYGWIRLVWNIRNLFKFSLGGLYLV